MQIGSPIALIEDIWLRTVFLQKYSIFWQMVDTHIDKSSCSEYAWKQYWQPRWHLCTIILTTVVTIFAPEFLSPWQQFCSRTLASVVTKNIPEFWPPCISYILQCVKFSGKKYDNLLSWYHDNVIMLSW
jgi:hypothetical protein